MDAHSRGQADDIDPADQWVLNPQTGNYELRLDHSAGQPPARTPGPRGTSTSGVTGTSAAARTATSTSTAASPSVPGSRRRTAEVPGQRRRRAAGAPEEAQAGTAQAPPGRRKRKPRKSRKKKVLLWTGGVMAFALVATGAVVYSLYSSLDGNISTVDVAGAGGSTGFKKDQPINILVIGTDKRTGDGNQGYGDRNSPGHADTTILFHVSKDRTNATAMSIPRDLVTDIPECTSKTEEGEKVIPGERAVRFNTSLGQSGRDPGCTMKTVHELTGLTVDHFMMADFNAVKTLSSAVGGVKVCLAKPVHDKKSHLQLPAGESVIEGEQALAFVRTRSSFGNKSDLDRIKIQQQFMSSMLRQMKSDETLTSPTKMYDLADAVTKALTVDSGIGSIKKLTALAEELSKIDMKNITFTTLPVIDNPNEPTPVTVVPHPTQAPQLFSMLENDISLTEVKQKEKDAKNAQAALLKGPRAKASEVRVDVYNGSGQQGAAQSTINWLQNDQGVLKSTNKANAPDKIAKTTLEFAPNQADQARALADMMGLPATALKQGTSDAEGLQAMTLTLGKDFKGAGVPITGPAKAPEGVQKVEADKQVCAQ
ncbi:LCP family protein [Streptomyces sp. NPDC047928]|uniref:LCP family protein n=1 Tax=unclassified Streptomyces TaxID=2593676 RepID=UPI003719CE39